MTSPLPPHVTVRSPVPTDLDAVVRVRQAQELADDGEPHTTTEGLRAEWEALGARLASEAWVAVVSGATESEGRGEDIFGYAQLARVGEVVALRIVVAPESRGVGIEAALLGLAEVRARELARAEDRDSLHLFAQATSNNTMAQEALADSAFAATSTFERMRLALDAPPSEPPAIAGIDVRPFRVGQDEEAVYRADEEAFLDERGKAPRSFEQWSRRLNLNAAYLDPALWLIAWDGEAIAGAALGEAVTAETGWIHHVGVRRPYRGRGLGAALTLHALGALYRRGIRDVRLNVDAASLTNAQQLYRRLGFRVRDTYTNYEKIVILPPRG